MTAPSLFPTTPIRDDSGTLLSDWKWITDNGTRRILFNAVANGTQILYTVPAKKIFYITSVYINPIEAIAITSGIAAIWIIDNTRYLMSIRAENIKDKNKLGILSLSIPIKLIAGETVTIFSSIANFHAYGGMTGWEVPI